MNRVLVVGGTGLLGRAVGQRFGLSCVSTGLTRAHGETPMLDSTIGEDVRQLVSRVKPTVIVNLVAERRPTRWSDEASLYQQNVTSALNVAQAANDVEADLVHVSTDYVFSSGGPHEVNAPHAPTNAYGSTKSDAERIVRSAHPGATIIRMPVLYGPVERFDECNLSELVHRIAVAEAPVKLDSWARRRPTHVADVAETLARIVDGISDWRGRALHLSTRRWHSQFQMGQLATRLMGRDPTLVIAVTNDSPDRPRFVDLKLDPSTPFINEYRSLASGLAELIEDYVARR